MKYNLIIVYLESERNKMMGKSMWIQTNINDGNEGKASSQISLWLDPLS